MFYRSIRSGCNYRLIIISLLSILGLLEIMTRFREGKNAQLLPLENIISNISNSSSSKTISNKSPTKKIVKENVKILLLAYAR